MEFPRRIFYNIGFRLAKSHAKGTEVLVQDKAGSRDGVRRPKSEGEAGFPFCLQCPCSCGLGD